MVTLPKYNIWSGFPKKLLFSGKTFLKLLRLSGFSLRTKETKSSLVVLSKNAEYISGMDLFLEFFNQI